MYLYISILLRPDLSCVSRYVYIPIAYLPTSIFLPSYFHPLLTILSTLYIYMCVFFPRIAFDHNTAWSMVKQEAQAPEVHASAC